MEVLDPRGGNEIRWEFLERGVLSGIEKRCGAPVYLEIPVTYESHALL